MHPSVCALRRSHLPLQGRLWENCRLKGSPGRGAVGASRLRGAASCLASILPDYRKPPRSCSITGLCGAALAQKRSVTPPQASPAGVNARPTMQGRRAAEPGAAGMAGDDGRGVSPLCVGADACIGPPTGLAVGWRLRVSARLRPQCRAGDFARRFEVCAAAGFPGRCKHRPLRNTGQGPARVCRISPPQGGNAPLRLRLAAQPPSGLRCPHRTARAEARLCSATAAPAPFRFLRRRRRSTPQPLAGEAL